MQRSRHSFRISGDYWFEVLQTNYTELEKMLQEDIAETLAIYADEVFIASIRVGSLIVEYIVTRNASQMLTDSFINEQIGANAELHRTIQIYREETLSNEVLTIGSVFTIKSSADPANTQVCGMTCVIGVAAGAGGLGLCLFAVWRLVAFFRRRSIRREVALAADQAMDGGAWYRRRRIGESDGCPLASMNSHANFALDDLPDVFSVSVDRSDDDSIAEQQQLFDWDREPFGEGIVRNNRESKFILSEPFAEVQQATSGESSYDSVPKDAISIRVLPEGENRTPKLEREIPFCDRGGESRTREPLAGADENADPRRKRRTKKKKKRRSHSRSRQLREGAEGAPAQPQQLPPSVSDQHTFESFEWCEEDVPQHFDHNFDEIYSSDFE